MERDAAEKASIANNPEVQALLAQAARDAVKQALAELQISQAVPGLDAVAMMQTLAGQIAELTDQGSNRPVRIAPEVLRARELAHDRMIELIKKARADGRTPKYRLRNKAYLAEQIVEPFTMDPQSKTPVPTRIQWFGLPSDVMVPVNDVAREIYQAYRESVGDVDDTRALMQKPMWMTAGGLVVEGTPQTKRVIGGLDATMTEIGAAPLSDIPEYEGFRVLDAIDPTKRELNVLGTVAKPAQQNYAGAM